MKSLKKYLKWLYSPFLLGCVVTTAIVYSAFEYYDRYQDPSYKGESRFYDLVRQLHEKSIDWRLVIRGPTQGHPDVAIITIDEAALEQEGRWPWPREKTAKVVEKAIELGAKTIAFDIVFAEEDANSSKPTVARIQKLLENKQQLSPEALSIFSEELSSHDSDRKFGETINAKADHLIMGAYFEEYSKADLEKANPHVDPCLDVMFERSPSAAYFSTDQRRPTVTDAHARQEELPPAIKQDLAIYFSSLEGLTIEKWLNDNPKAKEGLSQVTALVGLTEDYPLPGLLSGYLSNNKELVASNIEAVTEQAPGPGVVDTLFEMFNNVLSRKQVAVVQSLIRDSNLNYCGRFMQDTAKDPIYNDELLDESAWRLRYKDTEFVEMFADFSWESLWARANQAGAELPTGNFKEYLATFKTAPKLNRITPINRWWLNIPALGFGTKYTGFFNAHQDSDGTIRRTMLMARRGNHYFTSLALTSFLVRNNLAVSAMVLPTTDPRYKGVPLHYVSQNSKPELRGPASEQTVAGFNIQNAEGETVMSIPVDPSGLMAINYAGQKYSFAHISAADILSDSPTAVIKLRHRDPRTGLIEESKTVDKAKFFKDKMFFFGATATGIFDLRVTPFEENFPGVETHANMLSNLLVEYARATGKGNTVKGLPGFLRNYPDREAQYMLPAMLVVGILLSGLLSYFGSIAGLTITSGAMGGVYAIDKFILFDSGIVTTVLFPLTLISSIFVVLTFYRYFTEERKKQQLKGTFEKYVSPAIVNEVLADPENIELGGKKMELTVMFSDVRGFTTISEKLDPRALSDLLNSYLTPMTNLVFKNKGTLDKYMGDAIMAFWGAPIHFKDHASHACRCALEMIEKLKVLQADYRAKGLPEIDIGIGLNTGEMSVGNMGSDTVRSYTVMGDAVNLGSRLEGINKTYGTRIIISEFTYNAVKEDFVCREVDWVRVKGKLQPVRIFELVSEGSVSSQKAALLEKFNAGFAAYHERDFEKAEALFTEALHLDPEDDPSQLYLERCQEYKQEPPPADWDGVYNLKEK